MSDEPLTLNIQAPYGNIAVKLGQPDSYLITVRHWIEQLEHFQKEGNNSRALRDDLAGYQKLLLASEDTIHHFLDLKADARAGKRPKKNNLELVKEIQTSGKWRERPTA